MHICMLQGFVQQWFYFGSNQQLGLEMNTLNYDICDNKKLNSRSRVPPPLIAMKL